MSDETSDVQPARYQLMLAMLRGEVSALDPPGQAEPASALLAALTSAGAPGGWEVGTSHGGAVAVTEPAVATVLAIVREYFGEIIPEDSTASLRAGGGTQTLSADSGVDRLLWVARGSAAWTSSAPADRLGRPLSVSPGGGLYLPEGSVGTVHWSNDAMACEVCWKDVALPERRLVWQAFSALHRSVQGMPAHWREYWHSMWATFVFRLDGDPYGHLAPESQGLAGEPIDRNRDVLIDKLRRNPIESLALSGTPYTAMPLSLPPGTTFEVTDTDGSVGVRDASSTEAVVLPAGTTDALRYFAVPRTVDEVAAAMARDDVEVDRETLTAAVAYLVANKVLLPHYTFGWR